MNHRKKISLLFLIIIFLIIICGLFAMISFISQKNDKLLQIAENEKQIKILKTQISTMEEEIKNSDTAEFIEKVAREEFGMVKPREILYIDKEKKYDDNNILESN